MLLRLFCPTLSTAGVVFSGNVSTNFFGSASVSIIIGNGLGGASGVVDGGSSFTKTNSPNERYIYITEGLNAGSSGNSMTVTRPNSFLDCQAIIVGSAGSSNQLTVSSGGGIKAINDGGCLQLGSAAGSQGNSVLITDPGSYFTSHGGWFVNSKNSITIQKGASAIAGYIVLWDNSSVTVSGLAAALNALNTFDFEGSSNSLAASDGALLTGSLEIQHSSSNNLINVSGTGTYWTNALPNSFALEGLGNSFVLSSGAQLTSEATFDSRGAFNTMLLNSGSRMESLGDFSWGGSYNTIVLSGVGTSLTSRELQIGNANYGSNTSDLMVVTNGAHVTGNGNVVVGYGACCYSAVSNQLVVTGIGSVVDCGTNSIIVGMGTGGGNVLSLQAGGGLVAGNLMVTVLGRFAFASGTVKTVSASINNGLPFIIGDGISIGNYIMQGGTNSFSNGLVISNNSTLSGCGTVNGSVTNYGTIVTMTGCPMDFFGQVVNYGTILELNGAPVFHSNFINHGSVLFVDGASAANASVIGADVVIKFKTMLNYHYDVQTRSNLIAGIWIPLTNGLVGTGGNITVTNLGGAGGMGGFYRVLLHY